jgi:ABC-type uncharacterized transport system YnjBCD substrate-binding protein
MKTLLALSLSLMMTTAAMAVDPVGSDTFNTNPGFDLKTLTAENFYDTVVPLAKKEGGLTFFDFTDSFGPLFNDHIIPEFEAKYGIKVNYIRGEGPVAEQQLIAAHNSGAKAPADVYFLTSGDLTLFVQQKLMANIPFNKLLPSGAGLDPTIATVTNGINHGGVYMPFHRNQTAIMYDTRSVPEGQAPDDFDSLLAWAKAHPGKFAMTSPPNGGSGSGFEESVALAKIKGDQCRAALTKFDITKEEAGAYVKSDCMKPVWDYFHALLPVSEVTHGNSDSLNLIANGGASMATAWEDMAYDFSTRGLLPPTARLELLKEGQVGGGDGMFMAVNGKAPAAAILWLDFVLSKDVQLEKLKVNGSRSARTDIDPSKTFTPEQVARLIPTDQFATRAKEHIPAVLQHAMNDYFTANLLRQ